MFNWLNVELTNNCNKACWFCGRAEDRDSMVIGEMDLKLFKKIMREYDGELLQFHRDGDPLMYSNLQGIIDECWDRVTNIVTNGILLWDKAVEASQFTTICVSVIEDDEEQFENVKRFVEKYSTPVIIKFLGDYKNKEYEKLGLRTTRRRIHHPRADNLYEVSKPLIPEFGICLDFLYKPAIDWQGYFHVCNRYDPKGLGIVGDCNVQTLQDIWNSEEMILRREKHKYGDRGMPLCDTCEFWGVAVG